MLLFSGLLYRTRSNRSQFDAVAHRLNSQVVFIRSITIKESHHVN
jgi:hypothetical protein